MAKIVSNPFVTARSEGGLLPPDLLARIAASDPELGGLKPEEYGLAKGERLNEAASRAWARCKTYWAAFRSATEGLAATDTGVTETREQWLLPLFRELGYGRLTFQQQPEHLGERSYHLSHRAGELPDAPRIHTLGWRQEIDRPTVGSLTPGAAESGAGGRRVSAHSLVLEYLNRTDHLWSVVSNGRRLRLLRDSTRFSRGAFLEFDLEAMMEGGAYADFALMYLLLHRSRLPLGQTDAPACWLEKWHEAAKREGTRALGELRVGVKRAVLALGQGLLAHPENEALKARLRSGELTVTDYYRQLLRLVYRLIFLLVAEERDLLFPETARVPDRLIYRRHYSITRLRDLAEQGRRGDRHDDLWRSLQVTFAALTHGSPKLGLPPLNGGLFDTDSCADLDGAMLANEHLLEAVHALSRVRAGRTVRRVNYRDMDIEELGSVYESLLDCHPALDTSGAAPAFDLVYDSERKTTGSYYTPSDLVQELIRSALEPVIARALASGSTPREKEAALLSLAVCDPACGSGHCLLAAARRIGYEVARLRADGREPDDRQRLEAVRDAIRHCVYGVDVNPMAVDLCKVALWLEGQTPGKPLSFLNHRIKCGNSLVGATPETLAAGIPDTAFDPVTGDDIPLARSLKARNKKETREAAQERLPFPDDAIGAAPSDDEVREARTIGAMPDDAASQVHDKSQRYETFYGRRLEPKRYVADLWTSAFFWQITPGEPLPPTQADLRDARRGAGALTREQQARVQELALRHRFFHWHLEFPEVFGEKGGGFDCVLGNSPWEMLQLAEQEFFAMRDPEVSRLAGEMRKRAIDALVVVNPTLATEFAEAKHAAEAQNKLLRESGRFPLTAVGKLNTYALFAEQFRRLLSPAGRAALLCPTGIATDDTTKSFFADLVNQRALVGLTDFENREGLFPDVDSRFKFCALKMAGGAVERGSFAFFLTNTGQLQDEQRRFELTPEEIALLNPNTRTCPVFRTRADAELTKAIYRRVPVLVNEVTGENPWGVTFRQGLFNMTSDSRLFRTEPGPGLVPLYEAKLLHQFDHRWATYEPDGSTRDLTDAEKCDPGHVVTPRYWVREEEVEDRLDGKWDRPWLPGFRDIARSTDERTAIFSLLPRVGVGHKAPLMLPGVANVRLAACLLANADSLVFDYIARQKVGGTSLSYFILKQLPVLPPDEYRREEIDFVAARVLELVYTAWDMQPFARDMGYDSPPFGWDEERRAHLRAQLDAFYCHKYGLTEEETAYVLDPKAVYGADFPSETFRVLKDSEHKKYGEYRTERLVLSYYRDWRDGAMSQFDWWLSPRADRRLSSECTLV